MTFLNPLFLLGILLAGVPIIIHLWFQKKLKKIPFSNLQFLKTSEVKRFGWLKFREILILVLRCLFVSFLFLSLARPQLQRNVFRVGRLASVVIVVDNSYSMAYGENFTLAKKMAREILSYYSPNSEFCILPLCNSTKTERTSWVVKKSASRLIKKVELSYKSCSIKEILLGWPDRVPNYQVEYIYIGDGQEINFRDFPEELTEHGQFYWLRIPSGGNVGITEVVLKDPVAVSLDEYNLIVELANFSSKIWKGTASVGSGDYYLEQDCEIQPERRLRLEFLLPVSINRGQVEIYSDSLLVDNVYFFSKSLPHKLAILIVGRDEFLHVGLQPDDALKTPFDISGVNTLVGVDLRKFNMIILNGVLDISESDKIRLDNFLRREDAGIICLLGDAVGDNLRDFIARCCLVEKQIVPKGYVTLDWIDYKDRVFNVFLGSTTLKNIKFYRFHELIADKGIIAKLSGSYPFIVVCNNLAVLATEFTPQSTDIMYKTAFVPLIYRLIASLIFTSQNNEFYVGERMRTFDKLKAPTGEYINRGSEFLMPGFYAADDETLGVNVISHEGNLKILGTERAAILNIQMVKEEDLLGSDLSTIFLFLALLAILLELAMLLIL